MEAETVVAPDAKSVRRKVKPDEASNVGFVGLKLGDFKQVLETVAEENNLPLSDLCRDILEEGIDNYAVNHGVALLKSCDAAKVAAQKAAKSGIEPEVVVAAHKKLGEIRDILPPAPRRGMLFSKRHARKPWF